MEVLSIVIFMIIVGLGQVFSAHIAPYLPEILVVSLILIYWKYSKTGKYFYQSLFVGILVLLLIRLDYLYSWAEMTVMCSMESRVEAYKTIGVGPEYFDQSGWPLYLSKKRAGLFEKGMFNYRYRVESKQYVPQFGAIRYRLQLVDDLSGETMSKIDLFRVQQGWYWKWVKKSWSFKFCGLYGWQIRSAYAWGDYRNKENILHSVFLKKH